MCQGVFYADKSNRLLLSSVKWQPKSDYIKWLLTYFQKNSSDESDFAEDSPDESIRDSVEDNLDKYDNF